VHEQKNVSPCTSSDSFDDGGNLAQTISDSNVTMLTLLPHSIQRRSAPQKWTEVSFGRENNLKFKERPRSLRRWFSITDCFSKSKRNYLACKVSLLFINQSESGSLLYLV